MPARKEDVIQFFLKEFFRSVVLRLEQVLELVFVNEHKEEKCSGCECCGRFFLGGFLGTWFRKEPCLSKFDEK